jgi:hypothetical protein
MNVQMNWLRQAGLLNNQNCVLALRNTDPIGLESKTWDVNKQKSSTSNCPKAVLQIRVSYSK